MLSTFRAFRGLQTLENNNSFLVFEYPGKTLALVFEILPKPRPGGGGGVGGLRNSW